jgi:hypothetical protein
MQHWVQIAGLSISETGEELYRRLWQINHNIGRSLDDGKERLPDDYAISAKLSVRDPTLVPLLRELSQAGFRMDNSGDDGEPWLRYRFIRELEPSDFDNAFAIEVTGIGQATELLEPAHKISLGAPIVLKDSSRVRSLRFEVCSSMYYNSRMATIVSDRLRRIIEGEDFYNVQFQPVELVDSDRQPMDWPSGVEPCWEMTNPEMDSAIKFPSLVQQPECISILDPQDGSELLSGSPIGSIGFIKDYDSWTRRFDFACSPKLCDLILCSPRMYSLLKELVPELQFAPILRSFPSTESPSLRIEFPGP